MASRHERVAAAGAQERLGHGGVNVARGFESKAVESQQEEAQNRRRPGPPVDRETAARRAERATLMLARTRAAADLRGASAPAHRRMLEQAIADLDQRIASLSDG
jgi:hypothetical protein